jgi:uncharacterized membrane protein
MAPLAVLVVVVAATRLLGRLGVAPLSDWAATIRIGLATMFCFTAVAHFNSMRSDLIAMVPPFVPNPELMVTFTGVSELLGAVGLLVPRTRRLAGVALIALLIAILPANIYAAETGVTLRGAAPSPLVPRIALQLLFIGLVWWSAVRSASHATTDHLLQARE